MLSVDIDVELGGAYNSCIFDDDDDDPKVGNGASVLILYIYIYKEFIC